MATGSNTNITLTATTIADAEFRTIGALIANTFDSGGFTRTADTGQINWTTVTWPVANNTDGGYEIRRFTDAMQATAPFFVKITYRRGAAGNYVVLRFQIGTGSDGAGNITGSRFNPSTTDYYIAQSSSTLALYVAAGTNRFTIVSALATGGSSGALFSLERTVDNAGAVTADGCMFAALGLTTNSQYIPYSGTVPAMETSQTTACSCSEPALQTTGINIDGNVGVYPFFFYGIGEVWVSKNLAGCFVTDFNTNWGTYTVMLLGASLTMMRVHNSTNIYMSRGGTHGPTVFTALARFE